MGICAAFTEIGTEIYEQLVRGEEPKVPDGSHHPIDKAWNDFHIVFQPKGPPLSLAITGDALHPIWPITFREFCEGEAEVYCGLISPRLVVEIAEALKSVTASDYKRWEIDVVGDGFNVGEMFFDNL